MSVRRESGLSRDYKVNKLGCGGQRDWTEFPGRIQRQEKCWLREKNSVAFF